MSDEFVVVPVPGKMYTHVQTIYNMMVNNSTTGTNGYKVWEGKTTDLLIEAQLGTNYYTKIFTFFKNSGCLTQLRRGGGQGKSVWQINYPPTVELYNKYNPDKQSTEKQRELSAIAKILKELDELKAGYYELVKVSMQLQQRVSELERANKDDGIDVRDSETVS